MSLRPVARKRGRKSANNQKPDQKKSKAKHSGAQSMRATNVLDKFCRPAGGGHRGKEVKTGEGRGTLKKGRILC